MMRNSLQAQLLAWVLVPLVLLAALNATIGWERAGEAANLVTDRMLLASARFIAEQAREEDGSIQVLVPPAALEMFDIGSGDFVYFAITHGEDLLAGTADLPHWPRDRGTGLPQALQTSYRERPLRLVALDHLLTGPGPETSVTVTVGTTLNNRNALQRHLWLVGFGQQLGLIVTAGLFMVFGMRRGLRPALRLRAAVLARMGGSLEPLEPGSVQTELQPLVAAINQQIGRVLKQLAAQHRFVSNAAHQLRTPLTTLGLQATFARRRLGTAEQDVALAAIEASTQHLSRLAGQLLTLSRAEPGSRRERGELVELGQLAARVLDNFAADALARGIDLGLNEQGRAVVRGDATMLGELLSNVVDNALRYCPPASIVTVEVGMRGPIAVLAVTDNGPGVQAGEYDRVFERFYRVPGTAGDGSGLGLAIVKEVSETAGGTVSASRAEGGGLRVEVLLPAGNGPVETRPSAPPAPPSRPPVAR